MCVEYFLCFNDTAATEIYTYGHTLAIHDARTISALPRAVIDPAVRGALAVEQVDHLVFRHPGAVDQAAVAADRGAVGAPLDDADEELVAFLAEQPLVAGPAEFSAEHPVLRPRRGVRSEEHTSELQLLMRLSYAVFCLK